MGRPTHSVGGLPRFLFTSKHLINPADADAVAWSGKGPIASKNYSYAMLSIAVPGGRHGSVTHNDNSTVFETIHILPDTQFGSAGAPDVNPGPAPH